VFSVQGHAQPWSVVDTSTGKLRGALTGQVRNPDLGMYYPVVCDPEDDRHLWLAQDDPDEEGDHDEEGDRGEEGDPGEEGDRTSSLEGVSLRRHFSETDELDRRSGNRGRAAGASAAV
jgi:hypothetical protein